MRWKLAETDVLESDMRYKVLRCTAWGKPTGRYIAFLPRVNDRPAVLGGFNSADEAKRACLNHFNNRDEAVAA